MNERIEKFAKPIGQQAAKRAIDAYKKDHTDFQPDWESPMMYASGYTSKILARAFTKEWIVPLELRALAAGVGLVISLALLIISVMYLWSLLDYKTFIRFLVIFVPAVLALIYSLAKTYKTWAEAKKSFAEAKKIESESNRDS